MHIGRCVNDDIFRPISQFLGLLDATPDSLPNYLPPRVASFPFKTLSEGHNGSCVDVTLISEGCVIEDPGRPDFGRFSARRGGIPELNGVNRWQHARARLGGRIDRQDEHLGRHRLDRSARSLQTPSRSKHRPAEAVVKKVAQYNGITRNSISTRHCCTICRHKASDAQICITDHRLCPYRAGSGPPA